MQASRAGDAAKSGQFEGQLSWDENALLTSKGYTREGIESKNMHIGTTLHGMCSRLSRSNDERPGEKKSVPGVGART